MSVGNDSQVFDSDLVVGLNAIVSVETSAKKSACGVN